ncbi:MAG: RNA-binding S4 domain-containing protein [Brumimicrobium sp.]
MRIDKYIWFVRLTKTRTVATDIILKGKVRLNGEITKPSAFVKVGDMIEFRKNNAVFSYKIKALLERRVGAKLVEDYLTDITPEEEVEKYKIYQVAQANYRRYGTGKPSKKERRDLDDFLQS